MATAALTPAHQLKPEMIARLPNTRALAWNGELLYASRGYTLLSGRAIDGRFVWQQFAAYRPPWWRGSTSQHDLTFRLFRDGFHALAITQPGNLVAAVPGAIATLTAGENEFRVTHKLTRGTRPLHITAIPDGRIFWGEYFDNREREEVHVYASSDLGMTWSVAFTFPAGAIRHVHNIVYDRRQDCLWIFTGDYGRECRVIRASLDFQSIEEVLCGNQQARAVAAVVTENGLYFASDTPLERNHIYFLDRSGRASKIADLPSSSIYACKNRDGMFFSTMVEPSAVNLSGSVKLFGSADGREWNELRAWRKDRWPMKLFQYGNAFLPDGENHTEYLAVSTVAVENGLQTEIWRTTAG